MNQVFTEEQEFLDIYTQQLARWKSEKLNATQKKEITRLSAELEKLQTEVAAILTLANEFKGKTIDSLLSKSELNLGRKFLKFDLKL